MSQTADLLKALKKCLRAKGLTYRDVAEALQLSEASVKRIFSEQTFSVSRLEDVCRFLDMSIYDLARLARQGIDDDLTRLSMEQEQGLADDPLVLTYFYLLLTGRTPEKIAQEFGLDERQQTTMLVRLSRLKLVELYPNNRGRLLTGRRIDWRQNGPIRKMYQKQVQQAFLQSQFEKSDEVFRFETGELSDASVKIILKKIERLCLEFDEFAELDVSTPEKQKRAMGLLIGFRPWNYWHILESTANDMGLNAERSQRA
ncbi:MAG: helix-turn-helix transcriptional regulator [Gammaproteobacteria bacterium]|nr:helix-turn-helix transcriptional regulator [Gammaproteobacteria bacterium]